MDTKKYESRHKSLINNQKVLPCCKYQNLNKDYLLINTEFHELNRVKVNHPALTGRGISAKATLSPRVQTKFAQHQLLLGSLCNV